MDIHSDLEEDDPNRKGIDGNRRVEETIGKDLSFTRCVLILA